MSANLLLSFVFLAGLWQSSLQMKQQSLVAIDASLAKSYALSMKDDVKQAINCALEAWNHISDECISHCWRKRGILPL